MDTREKELKEFDELEGMLWDYWDCNKHRTYRCSDFPIWVADEDNHSEIKRYLELKEKYEINDMD